MHAARAGQSDGGGSDLIAIGVMKSVQRLMKSRSGVPRLIVRVTMAARFSSGVRVEQKMADFVSRVTETVLKTEERFEVQLDLHSAWNH